MKYMTINNRKVAFDDEKNVLSVIRKAGINLPTFCYHSELSTYGACRMCVVEDDRGKIFVRRPYNDRLLQVHDLLHVDYLLYFLTLQFFLLNASYAFLLKEIPYLYLL